MALTDPQKATCFEILGITRGPAAGTQEDIATLHNGFGVTLTLSQMDTLRDKVNTVLTDLDSTALTKVTAIVADYEAIENHTGELQSGSIGNIQGLSYSFEAKRARLTERLTFYVPVIDMASAIKRRDAKTFGGSSVSFIR